VAEESFEIEADTVEHARRLAWRTIPVPDDFRADIEVLCDGKPRPKVTQEIRVAASSDAKATYEARAKVPSGFSVVSERVQLPHTRGTAVGFGPDEASAYKEARRQVPSGVFTSKKEVTVLDATRVEVKVPWAAPAECILVAGRDFFTPKARISVRFVRDDAGLAEALVRVRSHPQVVSDLARMPIADRTHDFFSELYEGEDDRYGGDRDQPRVLGPVRMALRIVSFLEQAGSCSYSVDPNGVLTASFHYHADLFDELILQSVSLLVLRLGENEYTYRLGWSEGFRK